MQKINIILCDVYSPFIASYWVATTKDDPSDSFMLHVCRPTKKQAKAELTELLKILGCKAVWKKN